MKKFAKMSLAAAVAVVGLSGTASAADLAEAIKGVDISGKIRLRYEDAQTDTVGSSTPAGNTDTDADIEVTAKIPVNDMVTAIVKVDMSNDDNYTVNKSNLNLEHWYFQYANENTTVNYGRQEIPGRIADGANGDGLVALQNFGAFTLGAAGFLNHDIANGGQDVYSVIGLGSVGPVSLMAQYADVQDLASVSHVKADAKIGPVTAGVEYVTTDFDAETTDNNDHETFKAYVKGGIDALSVTVAYAATGKDGSGSLDGAVQASATAGAETPSEFLLWQMGSYQKNDLSAWAIDASYALTDKVSLRAAYADGDAKGGNSGTGADLDVSEVLGQVSYKMSSNLNTYFRISQYDVDSSAAANTEKVRGRVEVQYTF